jgi:hypothetical protein
VTRINLRVVGIDFGDWQSIRNHTGLVLQAITVASLATFIASSVHQYLPDICFHKEDKETILMGPLPLLGIFHSIIAGHMYMDVQRRHREVQTCILKKDEDTFRINRNVRLPGFAKFFLACLSSTLVLLTLLIRYQNENTSLFLVFVVTFALSIFWVMITELEDPVSGAWFGNKAPVEWLIEIEENQCEA